MTDAQVAWLRAHPDYEIVGVTGTSEGGGITPGTERHHTTGALAADGTFERRRVKAGEILVGIRKPMK